MTNGAGTLLRSQDPSKCRIIELNSTGILRYIQPDDPSAGLPANTRTCYATSGGSCDANCQGTNCRQCRVVTVGNAAGTGFHDFNTDNVRRGWLVQAAPFRQDSFINGFGAGLFKIWLAPMSTYVTNGGNQVLCSLKKK